MESTHDLTVLTLDFASIRLELWDCNLCCSEAARGMATEEDVLAFDVDELAQEFADDFHVLEQAVSSHLRVGRRRILDGRGLLQDSTCRDWR